MKYTDIFHRIAVWMVVLLLICTIPFQALAYEYDTLPEGTYQIRGSLSCFVNAMGGVEFGGPMLTDLQVNVSVDGSKTMTLFLSKSVVTIYSITCDTFVDATPSYVTETEGVTSGTIGYYDEVGNLITEGVSFTLSEDTAENGAGEQVHYVDSITFPVDRESSTYQLTLFVNSNVMGAQFTLEGYPATLTVDWSTVSTDAVEQPAEATKQPSGENAPAGEVEQMDGLNIYRPDTEDTVPPEAATEAELVQADGYLAFFRVPLLIAVGAAAVILILAGITLMALGRKEHEGT